MRWRRSQEKSHADTPGSGWLLWEMIKRTAAQSADWSSLSCLTQIYWLHGVGIFFCLGSIASLNIDACHLQTASVWWTLLGRFMTSHLWVLAQQGFLTSMCQTVRSKAQGKKTYFLWSMIFHLNLLCEPLVSLSPLLSCAMKYLLFEHY